VWRFLYTRIMGRKQALRLLEVGETAPDFRLQNLEGGSAAFSELWGEGRVLLAFFKISCPVCQLTLPFLQRIHNAGGLRIVPVSQDSGRDTHEFNQAFSLTLPMLLDTSQAGYPASNAYGISRVPTMFLVEQDGRIARVLEGWNRQEIERLGTDAGVAVIRPEERVPVWKAG
jgi:peroxiredoxin